MEESVHAVDLSSCCPICFGGTKYISSSKDQKKNRSKLLTNATMDIASVSVNTPVIIAPQIGEKKEHLVVEDELINVILNEMNALAAGLLGREKRETVDNQENQQPEGKTELEERSFFVDLWSDDNRACELCATEEDVVDVLLATLEISKNIKAENDGSAEGNNHGSSSAERKEKSLSKEKLDAECGRANVFPRGQTQNVFSARLRQQHQFCHVELEDQCAPQFSHLTPSPNGDCQVPYRWVDFYITREKYQAMVVWRKQVASTRAKMKETNVRVSGLCNECSLECYGESSKQKVRQRESISTFPFSLL